ncbi:MAG: hypothetical protein HOI80_04860 [Alphaproteobacteria bacterium]|jgi:3',5'-cyclic-AMP phosphodiesterase|nr:hypothetical protein [Alphaproteobacteria bacterium]MBT5540147.1 hypothetical protein [Alphaproteobacteria bacterium]MBT5654808.1 hypothetical protein [Alphaproteobacteria bacterium]
MSFKIVQLTDTHIPHPYRVQNDNLNRLERTIAHVNQEIQPQFVMISGDLILDHEDGIRGYEDLKGALETLEAPYYLMPGNHDNYEDMKEIFNDHKYLREKSPYIQYVLEDSQWPVSCIAFDTVVDGIDSGRVFEDRLKWLEKRFQECKKPILLFMHHPPISFRTLPQLEEVVFEGKRKRNLDAFFCPGDSDLLAVVKRYPNVKRLACGHGHFGLEILWGPIPLSVSPSVAPAFFLSEKDNIVIDLGGIVRKEPGFTLHEWDQKTESLDCSFHFVT